MVNPLKGIFFVREKPCEKGGRGHDFQFPETCHFQNKVKWSFKFYLLENKNNFTSNCTVFARNLVLSKRLDSLFVFFLVNPRQGTEVFEYDDVTRPMLLVLRMLCKGVYM